LGDVADIDNTIISVDQLSDGGQFYVGLENIEEDTGRLVGQPEERVSPARSSKFVFTSKHILYGKLRPNLNKVYLPDKEGLCSTDILPIRPREIIDREFLGMWMRTRYFAQLATNRSIGANLPRINPKTLLGLQVPLPPFKSQRKIVAVLDKTEETKRLRAKANELTQKLLQSVFLDMFGDLVNNSKGWHKIPLENGVCSMIDYRGKTPNKSVLGIPLITAKVVEKGMILPPNEYISVEEYDRWMRRGFPKKGDIVFTTEGPLGEVALIENDEKVALAQRLITLRADPKIMENTFLMHQLMTLFVQNQLNRFATGSTVKGISQAKLRKIIIAVPPMNLQKHFSMIVEGINDMRKRQDQSSCHDIQLNDILVNRAFNGELTA
jgi:type I restriction enzyme S subunit